jgi:hypothetical protein
MRVALLANPLHPERISCGEALPSALLLVRYRFFQHAVYCSALSAGCARRLAPCQAPKTTRNSPCVPERALAASRCQPDIHC